MIDLDVAVDVAARRTADAHGDKVARAEEAVADVSDWLLELLPEPAEAAARLGGELELVLGELESGSYGAPGVLVEVRAGLGKLLLGRVSRDRTPLLADAAEALGWRVRREPRFLRPPSPARGELPVPPPSGPFELRPLRRTPSYRGRRRRR